MSSGCGHDHSHGGHSHDHGHGGHGHGHGGHDHGHGGHDHSHDHGHDHDHDHGHDHGHSRARGGPRVHFARPPPVAAKKPVVPPVPSTTTATAKSENGKKKKGGKKKKHGSGAAPAAEDDDIDSLMNDLGFSGSGGSGSSAKTTTTSGDAELAAIRKARPELSAAFAAVKDRSTHPTAAQQTSAASAIAILTRLQQRLALTCKPDRLNATVLDTRMLLATASYDAVNLMNKWDRAAQTSPAVASMPLNASDLDKLGELCQVQDSLMSFITNTGRVFASCDRLTQAREMFDVAEKRLLKLETRPVDKFRGWVKTYAMARASSGLGQTSTPAVLRQLLWYIDDFAPGNPDFMEQLDGLFGCRCYFAVACRDGEQAFTRFGRAFRKHAGTEGVLLFSQNILFGCDMSEELETVLKAFIATCEETGVGFIEESFHTRVPTIQIDKFEFSKTGIVVVEE